MHNYHHSMKPFVVVCFWSPIFGCPADKNIKSTSILFSSADSPGLTQCMETEGVRPREDAEASRFQTCDSTSKKVNNVRSVNT